eukprot:UN09676
MAHYQGMNEGQPPAYNNQQIPVYAQPNQQMIGEQQPIIVVPITQPSNTTTIIAANTRNRNRNDDPSCLYISACFGFFIPIVGLIMMCVFGCGSGLPPRQTQAFRILVACTVAGMVINIIIYSTAI